MCTLDKAQKCGHAAVNAFKAEIHFHLPAVTVVKDDQFKMLKKVKEICDNFEFTYIIVLVLQYFPLTCSI